MGTKNNLYDLSIASVKEACEKYLLEKDSTLFLNRSTMEDIPLIGLCTPDWEEEFQIETEYYNGYIQTLYQCMVLARIVLKDSRFASSDRIVVDVTVLCTLQDDNISFASVHITNPKRRTLLSGSNIVTASTYQRLIDTMYDLTMEYRFNDNVFLYDKDKYEQLFHRKTEFLNMDQWFWDICSNHVVEEDWEKMDMFRSLDIRRRLKNRDYILKTEVRIKRKKDEIIWLRLIFVFLPTSDLSSLERIFILLKDCSTEMAEKMKNIMYARIDSLTQIWNRRYAEELICKHIESNGNGLFVIFDMDNFKTVNDTFGHMVGDELLRNISHTVSQKITDDDVFGRLGGDEFILYLSGDSKDSTERFSEIFKEICFEHVEDGISLEVHCSAGIVTVNSKDLQFSDLYKTADKALYEAKGLGKHTYKVVMSSLDKTRKDGESAK